MVSTYNDILVYRTLSYVFTYDVSFESPLISDYSILEKLVGTAGYSIDSIVTAHDAGSTGLPHTCLKCWQVSLEN